MTAKETAFLDDLKALLDKHEVTLESLDAYDSEETYCGTSYSFVGGALSVEIDSDLKDALRSRLAVKTSSKKSDV